MVRNSRALKDAAIMVFVFVGPSANVNVVILDTVETVDTRTTTATSSESVRQM